MSYEVCGIQYNLENISQAFFSQANTITTVGKGVNLEKVPQKQNLDEVLQHRSSILLASSDFHINDLKDADLSISLQKEVDVEIFCSSPSGPLYLIKNWPELRSRTNSSQESEKSMNECQPSLQKSESINLGQLFHIQDFQKQNQGQQRKLRSKQSSARVLRVKSCFNLPVRKHRESFLGVDNDLGSISLTKRVIDHAQKRYVISPTDQWMYGQENVGFVHLLYILKDDDVSTDILVPTLTSVSFLCEHKTLATTFADQMNGLYILCNLLFRSLIEGGDATVDHLINTINCVVLGANMHNMRNDSSIKFLRGLRESFFSREVQKDVWVQFSGICKDVILEAQTLLQEDAKDRFDDMYDGVFPLVSQGLL
eukprot:TRINITY_DN40692_c0_g2_i1.p1 TRINITY_DN40692_c0_g2~~TRINITY_DN40692_c0_g2_i1.p1  ORF type:complete len:369 (+),score=30.32 TRINITY_DN40692_c0_g2_i1:137-1243(+)